jgi:hypothetical protein
LRQGYGNAIDAIGPIESAGNRNIILGNCFSLTVPTTHGLGSNTIAAA